MTQRDLNAGACLALFALACLASTQAAGTDVPAQASVTFFHDKDSGGFRSVPVFVDNEFHGELPVGSYLETSVSPGPHLISGDWILFSADGKYSLVWAGSQWLLISPQADAFLQQKETATRVDRAYPALASARSRTHRDKYERALRKAGEAPATTCPADFDNVFHTESFLKTKPMLPWIKGGRLSVDYDTVRFKSRKKHLEIPVSTLLGVTLAGFKPNDSDPWLRLWHGTQNAFEFEFFSAGSDYNSVFLALQEAMNAATEESG